MTGNLLIKEKSCHPNKMTQGEYSIGFEEKIQMQAQYTNIFGIFFPLYMIDAEMPELTHGIVLKWQEYFTGTGCQP